MGERSILRGMSDPSYQESSWLLSGLFAPPVVTVGDDGRNQYTWTHARVDEAPIYSVTIESLDALVRDITARVVITPNVLVLHPEVRKAIASLYRPYFGVKAKFGKRSVLIRKRDSRWKVLPLS